MLTKKINTIILVFLFVAFNVKPIVVLADYANYRTCSDAEACVIGEFLYASFCTMTTTSRSRLGRVVA
jgi:hypothetical protein